ncbi:hypothetical protein Br6_04767 [Rhodococcus sp. Br-6]|nr:hypothetical protein Br6_04767 [Rhodococcus sp. Br-6]
MPRGRMEPDNETTVDHSPAVSSAGWDDPDEWSSDWASPSEFGDEFVMDEHPVSPAPPPAAMTSPTPVEEDTEATAIIPAIQAVAVEWTSSEPLPIAEDPHPWNEPHPTAYEQARPAVDFEATARPTAEFGSASIPELYDDEPEPPSQFTSDAYLRTPQKATPSAAGKRRSRRIVGAIIASFAVVAAGAVVAINSGGGDTDTSAQVAKTTAAVTSTSSAPSTVATAPGPGDTTTGPGVILGFDDAYYTQRNGAAAAGLLVPSQNTPATAAAIQADIDRLDPNVKHTIVITSTASENVYNVKLGLTTPDGLTHDYHQQYTVVSQSGRFYIANKLNCESVCPTP